jgi:CheY-like chemotaxis protein
MNIRVLLIEDDPVGAQAIARLLQDLGASVVLMPSAEAALQELQAAPNDYQLAVVDLSLPQADRMEMMNVIRGNAAIAHLPLVAVATHDSPELKLKALESGYNAYFARPLDVAAFTQALERLVRV